MGVPNVRVGCNKSSGNSIVKQNGGGNLGVVFVFSEFGDGICSLDSHSA